MDELLFFAAVVVIIVPLWFIFFVSSRRRHTRSLCDWSSDVCSSDLDDFAIVENRRQRLQAQAVGLQRIQVPLDFAYAPQIRMQRTRGLLQAGFVILVLLLEVLRPQEQALTPKNLGRNTHAVSNLIDNGQRPTTCRPRWKLPRRRRRPRSSRKHAGRQ